MEDALLPTSSVRPRPPRRRISIRAGSGRASWFGEERSIVCSWITLLRAIKKGSPPVQMPTGIVLRCTADLVPYANNARTHTPEQVKQIASASEKIPRPASES